MVLERNGHPVHRIVPFSLAETANSLGAPYFGHNAISRFSAGTRTAVILDVYAMSNYKMLCALGR